MEKFEIYISEIKTLKVKFIGRFIDLDHYTSMKIAKSTGNEHS
jgi:hypothetical protein